MSSFFEIFHAALKKNMKILQTKTGKSANIFTVGFSLNCPRKKGILNIIKSYKYRKNVKFYKAFSIINKKRFQDSE